MSLDQQRAGYRERLNEGDVVYFAVDEDRYGSKLEKITVQKGTIGPTHYNGRRKRYPMVRMWDGYEKEPTGACITMGISPREAFTAKEVERVLQQEVGAIALDNRPIDVKLKDPIANLDIATALASATIHRMAEDAIVKPHDPEY